MKTFLMVLSCSFSFFFIPKTFALDQDTTRIKELLDLGYKYEQTNKDSALLIYQKALSISLSAHYNMGAIKAYRYIGIVFSDLARYSEAIFNYEKSITLAKEINDQNEVATSLINLGNVYSHQGIYKESLDHYLEAVRIFEVSGDSSRLPALYTNMGSLYYEIKDYKKSEDYHRRSMRLAEFINDKSNIMASNINLGNTLMIMGKLDSAEAHFRKSRLLANELNDQERIYTILNGLASVYRHKENFDKAIQFGREALVAAKKTGNPEMIASANLSCGFFSMYLNDPDSTLAYLDEGIHISHANRLLSSLAAGYEYRFLAYLKLGMNKKAQADYELSVYYEDSIRNEEKFKEIGQIEGKYELEKELREKKIAEEKLESDAQQARDRRDRIQYFSIVFLLVLLFIGIKLVSNFKIPVRTSHFITFISVLLFFEFLLVFLDPWIDNWSGSVPVYKLLLNLLLAVLISPIHNWMLKILPAQTQQATVEI